LIPLNAKTKRYKTNHFISKVLVRLRLKTNKKYTNI